MTAALSRRGLLAGLLAAPVVIRNPGLLMPVKPVPQLITRWQAKEMALVLAYGAPPKTLREVALANALKYTARAAYSGLPSDLLKGDLYMNLAAAANRELGLA